MLCLTEFLNVTKAYGDGKVISDLSLTLGNGEHIVIMGESGAGKTTLLQIAASLEKPDSGQFKTDDVVAYMFQDARLLPTFNVRENVYATLKSRNKRDIADKYIKLVELEEHIDKYPAQLSGGMRQRVAFARFLAFSEENNATLLLLDEPFSALDEEMRDRMLQILMEFSKDKSVIYVTHNVLEAEKFSNRIIKI